MKKLGKKYCREVKRTTISLDNFFTKVKLPSSASQGRASPQKNSIVTIDLTNENDFPPLPQPTPVTIPRPILKTKNSLPESNDSNLRRKRLFQQPSEIPTATAKLPKLEVEAKVEIAAVLRVVEEIEDDSLNFLTEEQINDIIVRDYRAIEAGTFECPVNGCKYKCKAKQAMVWRIQTVTTHLTRHLKEDKVWCTYCGQGFKQTTDLNNHIRVVHKDKEFKCSDCKFATSSQVNLDVHVKTMHTQETVKCLLPDCGKEFASDAEMFNHLLLGCCRPDWAFCTTCKVRMYTRRALRNHWNESQHEVNSKILQSIGLTPSKKPDIAFKEEMRKVEQDPVGYRNYSRSGNLLGSSHLPIISVEGTLEEIESFDGHKYHDESTLKGTLWCSETEVDPVNQCRASIIHNLFPGPQEFINIPVTRNTLFGPRTTTYRLPITSNFDCLTTNFNYSITCRVHTPTRGTRGIGLSLEQTVRLRLHGYTAQIKFLKSVRENEETRLGHPLTPMEFENLEVDNYSEDEEESVPKMDKKKTHFRENYINCRKLRHFAASDCSIDNLVFSVIASYPEEKDEDTGLKGQGRFACIRGEAYYQYAIKSCDEDTGGLDELREYNNPEKWSHQLDNLKIRRNEASKKTMKKRHDC